MTSPTDIVNQALDSMGVNTPIQGISPAAPSNSVVAQVASRNYQTQVDAIFRSANWNCTRQQAALNLFAAAAGTPENPSGTSLPIPPVPYLYEYAYPPDCLKLRFVIPTLLQTVNEVPIMTTTSLGAWPRAQTAIPFTPNISQDANGNDVRTILTNARGAQGIYTKRVTNPDLWDSQLKTAVIATLAAMFVPPLNMDKGLMAAKVQLAVGVIAMARLSDGNEGITSTDHYPDWIQARNAGGWHAMGLDGAGGGEFWSGGWDSIEMPDSVSY